MCSKGTGSTKPVRAKLNQLSILSQCVASVLRSEIH